MGKGKGKGNVLNLVVREGRRGASLYNIYSISQCLGLEGKGRQGKGRKRKEREGKEKKGKQVFFVIIRVHIVNIIKEHTT